MGGAEEELGRESFSDLFAYTRTIFRKARAKETILKEFREFVVKSVEDSRKLNRPIAAIWSTKLRQSPNLLRFAAVSVEVARSAILCGLTKRRKAVYAPVPFYHRAVA